MSQPNPVEHDTRQFALYQEQWKAEERIQMVREEMHRLAGDKRDTWRRGNPWGMTLKEARNVLETLESVRGIRERDELKAKELELIRRVGDLKSEIARMEGTWRRYGWTRWFECLNADGHIHRSIDACPTLHRGLYMTAMGWATHLSGLTLEEALADLGPRLCSVCFPAAPVELCRKKSDITREQRAAEKAEKEQAKKDAEAAKQARIAERAAKAEANKAAKGPTPADRRNAAIKAIVDEFYAGNEDREDLAAKIEAISPLGKTERWQGAVAEWAKQVREEENLRYAVSQYGQNCGWANL